MRTLPRFGPLHFVLALFTAGLLVMPSLASAGKSVVVFPVNSEPYGKTYSEWSDAWWQWAYSIPAATNPLFDETGDLADQGQSGQVWFLAGVFNVTGTAERSITIPRGRALFIPILNAEWDNLCPILDPQPAPEDLVDVLTANVAAFLDAVDALECTLDGVELPHMFNFRVGPGEPYSTTFPEGNLFQEFGCANVTPGTYYPFVSGGYYLMLAPLSAGTHTLHFSGHTSFFGGFGLDITYHINIANPNGGPGSGPILASVRPNPLNPEAKLEYRTPKAGPVKITLYDVSGRLVRTLVETPYLAAGRHEVTIDGVDSHARKLASGVYVYKITAGGDVTTGRFTILK
jgi:hypothetical protein